MSTNIFNRTATTGESQFNAIDAAYRASGLTPPSRGTAMKALVDDHGPNVHQVAATLAADALTTTQEPSKWYAAAVDAIKTAHARVELAEAFRSAHANALAARRPQYLAEALDDLAPIADKEIRKLVTAARKLPTGDNAMDPESNIANNSGQALQDVRTVLATLGKLASIYTTTRAGKTPPALNTLLPLLELPTATIERIAHGYTAAATTTNSSELHETRLIRSLADHAALSLDLALINIARDTYPGISLKLATPAEYSSRQANATRAFERVSDDPKGKARVL